MCVLSLIYIYVTVCSGRGSSGNIVTGYGLDGPGTESRWGGEIFRTCPDRPWGPPSLLYNGYRVFPGGKERPGRDADPSPPSNAVVMKEQSYTSTLPMGRTACTEPQCLYRGALSIYLYVGPSQHDISLLFLSVCQFLITRLMFLMFSLGLLSCFRYQFFILRILSFLYYSVYRFSFCIRCLFPFLYKSTDGCHWM